MIVSVHQPQYLPYIGFFHKVSKSDVYVSLDSVQYTNRGFIHRNKIKTPHGCIWLTIPVINEQGCRINEVKINNNLKWAGKHIKSMKRSYSKAPFFNDYWKDLEKIYQEKWEMLVDLDEALLKLLFKNLGINVRYLKLSELNIESKSTLRIINICKELGADTYLSGPGGKKYMDENMFKKENITLIYQDFKHPTYEQRFGKFIPNLSILDLLFNYGEETINIIKGEKK